MSRIHNALQKVTAETKEQLDFAAERLAALEVASVPNADAKESVKPPEDSVFREPDRDLFSRNGRARLDLDKLAHEEIVRLVQRVFVLPNSAAQRVVIFANVDKGHGSSQICVRAGEILARHTAESVCLVDANLGAPSLHQTWDLPSSPGLADAILDRQPIKHSIIRVAGANLWLLPAGSPSLGCSALFAPDRLSSRLAELKEKFDYVLVDVPAMSTYPTAVLLGQMTDGVILVVEANATRREAARSAKETLQDAKIKLLGAVLNNRTFPIPERIYRKL